MTGSPKPNIPNWTFFGVNGIVITVSSFDDDGVTVYTPSLNVFSDDNTDDELVVVLSTEIMNECPKCAALRAAYMCEMLWAESVADSVQMLDDNGKAVEELKLSEIMSHGEDDEEISNHVGFVKSNKPTIH